MGRGDGAEREGEEGEGRMALLGPCWKPVGPSRDSLWAPCLPWSSRECLGGPCHGPEWGPKQGGSQRQCPRRRQKLGLAAPSGGAPTRHGGRIGPLLGPWGPSGPSAIRTHRELIGCEGAHEQFRQLYSSNTNSRPEGLVGFLRFDVVAFVPVGPRAGRRLPAREVAGAPRGPQLRRGAHAQHRPCPRRPVPVEHLPWGRRRGRHRRYGGRVRRAQHGGRGARHHPLS